MKYFIFCVFALITTSCATVTTHTPENFDTRLRTETETQVKEGTKQVQANFFLANSVLVKTNEFDTCSERQVEVVDRTQVTVRELNGAGMAGLGALALTSGGAITLAVAPGLSDKKETVIDKETGEEKEVSSNQTTAYVMGGLLLAAGILDAAWIGVKAAKSIDEEVPLGEIRIVGDWTEDFCNERPVSNRAFEASFGKNKGFFKGVLDEKGEISIPRDLIAEAYANSTTLEEDKLEFYVEGDKKKEIKGVVFRVSPNEVEKEFQKDRELVANERIMDLWLNFTSEYEEMEAEVKACQSYSSDDPRCLDMEGVFQCRTDWRLIWDTNSQKEILDAWERLENLKGDPKESFLTNTCIEVAKSSCEILHDQAITAVKEQKKEEEEAQKAQEKEDKEWAKVEAVMEKHELEMDRLRASLSEEELTRGAMLMCIESVITVKELMHKTSPSELDQRRMEIAGQIQLDALEIFQVVEGVMMDTAGTTQRDLDALAKIYHDACSVY